jgi:hypothetical protein
VQANGRSRRWRALAPRSARESCGAGALRLVCLVWLILSQRRSLHLSFAGRAACPCSIAASAGQTGVSAGSLSAGSASGLSPAAVCDALGNFLPDGLELQEVTSAAQSYVAVDSAVTSSYELVAIGGVPFQLRIVCAAWRRRRANPELVAAVRSHSPATAAGGDGVDALAAAVYAILRILVRVAADHTDVCEVTRFHGVRLCCGLLH